MSRLQTENVQWLFQDSSDVEQIRRKLLKEQRRLERERGKLEMEREQLKKQRHAEEQRMLREAQLFETKWKILEEEYAKLAKERQAFEAEQKEYQNHKSCNLAQLPEELFFSGVSSELSMKKRYKDLIKIFHPDNMDGDTQILQKINQEYDEMKRMFCG